MKAEYRDNKKEYLNYYDEVEVCETKTADIAADCILSRSYFLKAIQ